MKMLVFKALEKVFSREIVGHILQSNAKIYSQLEREGYVEKVCLEMPRTKDFNFAMTVKGWGLTHFGRYEYCRNCK